MRTLKHKCTAILLFLNGIICAQITFSEVMFNPATNEYHDEYIEVFNTSYTDSINFRQWSLTDGIGQDRIIPFQGSVFIPPRTFALILDGSYDGNSNTYDSIITHTAAVFIIDNNSFGANGLSNSNDELLSLYNDENENMTSYRYSHQNEPGYSDEKRILDAPNSDSNWSNSRCFGGTPGRRNSVTPYEIDPVLYSDAIRIPNRLFSGYPETIYVSVEYAGTVPFRGEITLGINVKRVSAEPDIFLSEMISYFDSGIQNVYPISIRLQEAGTYHLTAYIRSDADQNLSNNRSTEQVIVLHKSQFLRINEIKFLTEDKESEWIELVNTGQEPVFLRFWMIADQKDTTIIDSSVYIYPQQFKIISSARSGQIDTVEDTLIISTKFFINLNNQSDILRLIQPDSVVCEQVNYNISWLEGEDMKNVSLERIHPSLNAQSAENWGPCVAQARSTPSRQNSIFQIIPVTRDQLSVSPNPFSPDGDGTDDVTIISGTVPQKSVRLRIRLFDITGRHIRTLVHYQFSGSQFNVAWDGKDKRGAIARMGIYIILCEAINDRRGVLYVNKTSVVLAKKL